MEIVICDVWWIEFMNDVEGFFYLLMGEVRDFWRFVGYVGEIVVCFDFFFF